MLQRRKSSLEHQLLEAEASIERKEEGVADLKNLLSKMSLAVNNLSPSLDLALNEMRSKMMQVFQAY